MMFCRACRTQEATSREHVFPSAIGGRLVARGILCADCNAKLGTSIDAALVTSLEPVRVALAIEGDRGQSTSIRGVDEAGKSVVVGPGFTVRNGGAPEIVADAERVQIRGDQRQLRQFAASLRRKGKKLKIENATHHYRFPKRVNFQISFDEAFLRSALKTALVFTELRVDGLTEATRDAWTYVTTGLLADGMDVRLVAVHSPWWPESLGPVSHRVLIDLDETRALFDIRYFGAIGVRARIQGNFGSPVRLAYGIDPRTRAMREEGWDGDIQPDPTTTRDALVAHINEAFAIISQANVAIQSATLAEQIRREAMSEAKGDPVEAMRRAMEKVAILVRGEDTEQVDPALVAWLEEQVFRLK